MNAPAEYGAAITYASVFALPRTRNGPHPESSRLLGTRQRGVYSVAPRAAHEKGRRARRICSGRETRMLERTDAFRLSINGKGNLRRKKASRQQITG